MIYVYDVLLNFNDELYDFYDWNELDSMSHFRKITFIKVSEKLFNKIISKGIQVNKEFLNEIKGKSNVFNLKNMANVKYTSLFTNGYDVVGVLFNSNGKIMKLSRVLINEELELMDLAKNLKVKKISYVNITSNYVFNRLTRSEKEIVSEIVKFLEDNKDNHGLISYLHYEWFETHKTESDAFLELISSIKERFSDKHLIFRDILKSIKS